MPQLQVNPKADVKSKKNKHGKTSNPKASFHRRNNRSKASTAENAERREIPDASPPGESHDGGPADGMPAAWFIFEIFKCMESYRNKYRSFRVSIIVAFIIINIINIIIIYTYLFDNLEWVLVHYIYIFVNKIW